jgi:hypothetical protein
MDGTQMTQILRNADFSRFLKWTELFFENLRKSALSACY